MGQYYKFFNLTRGIGSKYGSVSRFNSGEYGAGMSGKDDYDYQLCEFYRAIIINGWHNTDIILAYGDYGDEVYFNNGLITDIDNLKEEDVERIITFNRFSKLERETNLIEITTLMNNYRCSLMENNLICFEYIKKNIIDIENCINSDKDIHSKNIEIMKLLFNFCDAELLLKIIKR